MNCGAMSFKATGRSVPKCVAGEVDRAHPALTEQFFETVLAVQDFADETFETRHLRLALSSPRTTRVRPPAVL
jgi:hypothetical protein